MIDRCGSITGLSALPSWTVGGLKSYIDLVFIITSKRVKESHENQEGVELGERRILVED